jgi:hypothetical protein
LPTTWMLHRFRSAFLRENLLFLVIRLLKDADLSEWEILNLLYSRYETSPGAKEFRKLLETLVSEGYASLEPAGKTRRLRLDVRGTRLLRGIEEEYRSIISGIEESSSAVPSLPLP